MRVKGIKTIVIVVAAAMVLFASIGAALAYFSDYDKAIGEKEIVLGGQTKIWEDPQDDSKTIRIDNVSKDNVGMIARVKVIGPVEIDYPKDKVGEYWEQKDDGWWYYTRVIPQGESSTDLFATWSLDDVADLEDFDVVVVHEAAIATYDAANNVIIPDGWAKGLVIQDAEA